MKILRLLRNVAVLFLLVMALLALGPGARPARADKFTYCGYKKGSSYCLFDGTTGACIGDVKCTSSSGCLNMGCTNRSVGRSTFP